MRHLSHGLLLRSRSVHGLAWWGRAGSGEGGVGRGCTGSGGKGLGVKTGTTVAEGDAGVDDEGDEVEEAVGD